MLNDLKTIRKDGYTLIDNERTLMVIPPEDPAFEINKNPELNIDDIYNNYIVAHLPNDDRPMYKLVDQINERMRAKYGVFYMSDSLEIRDLEQRACDYYDEEFIKLTKDQDSFYSKLANSMPMYNGDFISSDREAASFILAIQELGVLDTGLNDLTISMEKGEDCLSLEVDEL